MKMAQSEQAALLIRLERVMVTGYETDMSNVPDDDELISPRGK